MRLTEVSCPICNSQKSKLLFRTRDYTFACSDAVFGVRKCLWCGCGYLSPRPSEVDTGRFYPDEYYWSWERATGELSWEEIIKIRRGQLEAKARWLSDMEPGRLMDIGAQKGEFIWWMQRLGWQAEGVELDASVPNPANMPIRYGDFLNMDFQPNAYDCITMWAVLEHVYHPAKFIERAASLLRPGGKLVGVVTNLNSIQAYFYRADDYPRHLTIFTHGSIEWLCRKHSLELTRVLTGHEIFGGALNGGLVYAVKRLFGYSRDEIFREWKQQRDPMLFYGKWRGMPSGIILNISRLDRILTYPMEKMLDRLGYGFNMTFTAVKKQ